MKKSLIALAVLAASGASFAQSTVTVYGTIDTSLTSIKSGGVTTTALTPSAVATSVYGFKGSEDLGGGLKANFLLENEFAGDTGASGKSGSAFSRQAWVGFSGSFGEVKLGKVNSAMNDTEGAAGAIFGSPQVGPIGLVFQSDYETGRTPNTIYYAMPTVNGFGAAVSYGLDEKVTATATAPAGVQYKSFNVNYSAGPLFATVGYQAEKSYGTSTELQMTQANVTYDLGVVTLLGAYGHVGNAGSIAGNKVNEWELGVNVPVSAALTASAGYASSTEDFAAVGVADVKHTAFSVGGAYAFSKRTSAYIAASTDKYDNAADSTNKYAVGIIHKF